MRKQPENSPHMIELHQGFFNTMLYFQNKTNASIVQEQIDAANNEMYWSEPATLANVWIMLQSCAQQIMDFKEQLTTKSLFYKNSGS